MEDLYGDRGGCRQGGSIGGLHDRNQTLRFATVAGQIMSRTWSTNTHPFQLIYLTLMFGHPFSDAIRIPECPYCQLVENPYLREDVKVPKPLWFLFVAVGVEVGCFCEVLTSGIFIPNIETASMSVYWRGGRKYERLTRGRDVMRST